MQFFFQKLIMAGIKVLMVFVSTNLLVHSKGVSRKYIELAFFEKFGAILYI